MLELYVTLATLSFYPAHHITIVQGMVEWFVLIIKIIIAKSKIVRDLGEKLIII